MPKHSKLQDWIDEIGTTEISKALKVNISTVRHWRCGYSLPKSRHMLEIKKLTRGRLTCDAMIENFFSNAGR